MVPADSRRIPRVPRYSGCRYASSGFMYAAVMLYGGTFQSLPGLFPVRSPLLGESLLFSFPAGTKMFQFPALASIPDGCHPFRMTGCPIRKSADQRLCAPPRGFSQLAASFIASESLGIRRAPFLTFSAAAGIGGLAYTLAFYSSRLYTGIVFCARFYVSLVTSCHRTSLTVENNGFEPLTPCVQSRCSSQLS